MPIKVNAKKYLMCCHNQKTTLYTKFDHQYYIVFWRIYERLKIGEMMGST